MMRRVRRGCPPGQFRRDGVYVPSTCIEDRGAPGKRPKVIKITRGGKLGGPGYLSKPDPERHRLLRECVAKYGYQSCLGSVNALGVFRKRGPREQRDRIDADRQWLVGHFGGPGSFTMRTNKARSRSVREYVMVGDNPYPVDSAAQLRRAKQAMRELGVESTSLWYGHPDDPSSYRSARILSLSGPKLMRRNARKRQTLTAPPLPVVPLHQREDEDVCMWCGAPFPWPPMEACPASRHSKRQGRKTKRLPAATYRSKYAHNPFTGPPIERSGKVGHVHQYRNPVRGPQYETWDEGECEELYVRVGNRVYRVDKSTNAAEDAMRADGIKEVEVWSGWPGKKGSVKKEGMKLVPGMRRP